MAWASGGAGVLQRGVTLRRILAWLFAAGCVGAVYARLRFGVDLHDEAFYLALPYRFVLGDRPFVDEWHLQQTAGLLTYPFVEAWTVLHGGTDGLVLASRRLYLVFSVGVAAGIFASLTRAYDRSLALLASLIAVVFVPFNIPALGYNSLGAGFLALGIFALAAARGRPAPAAAAGLVHGFACVAYPPFAVVAAFLLAASAVSRVRREALVFYALGLAGAGLPFGAYLLWVGPENVIASLRYAAGHSLGGNTADGLLGSTRSALARAWILVAALLLLAAGVKWSRWLAYAAVVLLPLAALSSLALPWSRASSMYFVTALGLAAPVPLLALRDRERARTLLAAVWLPSFVGALAAARASGNGFVNLALGLLPAAIASSLALGRLAWEICESVAPRLRPWLAAAPVVLIDLILIGTFSTQVYGDGPIPTLTDTLPAGPYAGMRTTPARRRHLEEISEQLQAWSSPEGRILVYNGFPAGYLLTPMRPATNSCWLIAAAAHRPDYAESYRRNLHPENLVLRLEPRRERMVRSPRSAPAQSRDPLDALVRAEHIRVVERPRFSIYTSAERAARSDTRRSQR